MLNCWLCLLSVALPCICVIESTRILHGHGRTCTSLSKFLRMVPGAPGPIRPGRKHWSCYGGTRYYGTFG
ncbi:hypothetical protein M6B38_136610 [Iris pallida]|uniref:Secreted protein n=1 Tax=Iris pallida TaxID=29817 RepID=A0AAX6FEY5_IRIPA|nr:hypothetical protein M6B38_136610 [Iris pallida]